MKRIGSLRKIASEVKRQIADYALKSEKPRTEVAQELQVILGNRSPSEDTLLKMISHARSAESPLDKPWHLDKTPDLSAEAIAAIFEVQLWLEKVKESYPTAGIKEWTEDFTNGEMTTTVYPLTMREALWISKLHKVNCYLTEPEMFFLAKHKQPIRARRSLIENPSRLWEAAKTYADYERLCVLAKTDFDTSRLDEALKSGSIGKVKYDLFSEYKSKKDGEVSGPKRRKE